MFIIRYLQRLPSTLPINPRHNHVTPNLSRAPSPRQQVRVRDRAAPHRLAVVILDAAR